MADRVQFENEQSENGVLGACLQESAGEDIATSSIVIASQVLLYIFSLLWTYSLRTLSTGAIRHARLPLLLRVRNQVVLRGEVDAM